MTDSVVKNKIALDPRQSPRTGREVLDASITEKAFMQQVIDLATLHGWLCYHTHDSRRSSPGFPDLVLIDDRCLLFVELKRASGRLSYAQIVWRAAFLAVGADYRLWFPSMWDEIVRVLT